MKIVLTGSLGHINLPLTKELVDKGHSVTVITHNAEHVKDIEKLEAIPAVGSIADENFLATTFTGADAVYLMVTLTNANTEDGIEKIAEKQANIYSGAVHRSNVKHVVNLSSVGANLGRESGALYLYHVIEKILNKLDDVNITFIRPTAMYYNLFSSLADIKQQGKIITSADINQTQSWVAPEDIAPVVAAALTSKQTGKNIQYVASDEISYQEIAKIIGIEIGNPNLKSSQISDDKMLKILTNQGIPEKIARELAKMTKCIRKSDFYADYRAHKPKLGTTKMKDFARLFAQVYEKQN